MSCRIKICLALLTAWALLACAPTSAQKPASDRNQNIVAVVNSETVKHGEFKQELDNAYWRFHNAGQFVDGFMYQQLKKEIRESLINLILLDHYSRKLGIQVDSEEIDKYFKAKVAKFPSKKAFRTSLAEAGLTEADVRHRIKRTLAAEEVVRTQVENKITVSDEELRAYYDANPFEFEHDTQVHAAHILISVHPLAQEATKQKARKKITDILKRIKAGEDFAELARQFSEGPSKVNGGDLGYFGAAQMAPAFETAAFLLQPGEVSDVVTTQFGYHLIKVYDRKPAGKETFSEAAPRLRERFKNERRNAALQQLVDQLKSEARIERFDLGIDD